MAFLEALAGQAAIAVDNATLLTELQRSNIELTMAYDNLIDGWAQIQELRDSNMEGHNHRVTELATQLASEMELKSDDLGHLRRGAMLHDVGMAVVPDTILLKPSPLSVEEKKILEKHPAIAFRLLGNIHHLRPALDIPYCHHERWDGSGYPRGLKGTNIPMFARIFAVVDVWDSLLSNRAFRKAWPKEQALDYLREQSGKIFDPLVVRSFLRFLNSS
jgi:HD-GYP domain-containing protein (c-di-GMP phosphodiesterase class II)